MLNPTEGEAATSEVVSAEKLIANESITESCSNIKGPNKTKSKLLKFTSFQDEVFRRT